MRTFVQRIVQNGVTKTPPSSQLICAPLFPMVPETRLELVNLRSFRSEIDS